MKHADGGNADPHLARVARIRHDRMQDEARPARGPFRPGRVPAQAFDMPPCRARVFADEQSRRLDARVDAAMRARHAPGGFDRRFTLGVGEALAGVAPCLAEIFGGPDRRPEPFAAGGRVNASGCGIADDMLDRPVLAKRSPRRPLASRRIALQYENALLGADKHAYGRHGASPYFEPYCGRRASLRQDFQPGITAHLPQSPARNPKICLADPIIALAAFRFSPNIGGKSPI